MAAAAFGARKALARLAVERIEARALARGPVADPRRAAFPHGMGGRRAGRHVRPRGPRGAHALRAVGRLVLGDVGGAPVPVKAGARFDVVRAGPVAVARTKVEACRRRADVLVNDEGEQGRERVGMWHQRALQSSDIWWVTFRDPIARRSTTTTRGFTSASKASASSDSNASFMEAKCRSPKPIFFLSSNRCESGTRGGGDDDAGDEARPASPVPV